MSFAIRSLVAAFLVVHATACDSPAGGAASSTSTASPAGTGASTAATSKPAPVKTEAPAAPKEFTDEDGMALSEKMADVFANNASDCDKMASEAEKFFTDNAEAFKQLKALGDKQTPEQKKAFGTKYKDRNLALMKKMEPAIGKCASNAKVQEAMKKMPL